MRYYDDLNIGDRYSGGPVSVTEDDIVAFARQFDPQPFHLDHEAAEKTLFNGMAASGWHTGALTMRMTVEGEGRLAGGFIGLGVEEMAWPSPVRPGDTLRVESEVLDKRLTSRPDRGIARIRTITYNQKGEVVQRLVANLLVPVRQHADAAQ